jgi:hypothetical protein
VERQVLQRDNSNIALIPIGGYVNEAAELIEARLIPVNSGQGIATNWQEVAKNITKGTFVGQILGTGGWYNLEIRSVINSKISPSVRVPKVGIGEVFLISGQSNAEGNAKFEGGEIGSKEDRISVLNYINISMDEDNMPFIFTPLIDGSKIGPYNPVPWFWARMAEKIVQKYNVPVLLFGAAIGGMGSELWYESMKGMDFREQFGSHIKFAGSPYDIIERSLKNFVSRTGVRALLWQQGESDVYTDNLLYVSRLKEIIAETSINIDAELPWIMAISSRTPHVTQIAGAQYKLIETLPNVYLGPNTDNIANYEDRADGIHFHKEGLIKAADAWFDAISEGNLLSIITPVKAKGLLQITNTCPDISNQITLSIDNQFTIAKWSSGETTSKVNVGKGAFNVKARKKGIVYFSPTFRVDKNEFITSKISVNGKTIFCEGDKANSLVATSNFVSWNNGELSQSIVPEKTGTYSFLRRNNYQCLSKSDSIVIDIIAKPVPSFQTSTGFFKKCQTTNLDLFTKEKYLTYEWSNSSKEASIKIENAGLYGVKVTNQFGCISEEKSLEIVDIPSVAAPLISQISPFTYKLVPNQNFDQTFWYKDDKPIAVGTDFLRIKEPGIYKIIGQSNIAIGNNMSLNCSSLPSSNIEFDQNNFKTPILFWPNPATTVLNLESPIYNEKFIFSIFDVQGKLAKSGSVDFSNETSNIDLNGLLYGKYILKIGSRSNFVNYPFFVKP